MNWIVSYCKQEAILAQAVETPDEVAVEATDEKQGTMVLKIL